MKTDQRAQRLYAAIAAIATAAAAFGSPALHVPDAERPLGVPSGSFGFIDDGLPTEESGTALIDEIIAVGGPLVAVIGLIVGAAWVMRKASGSAGLAGRLGAGGKAPSGVVDVLARYPVARGQTLALIRVGSRVLVVSQTHGRGGGMRTLSEITGSEEVANLVSRTTEAEGASMAARFRDTLAGESQRMDEAAWGIEEASRTVHVEESGDRVELLRTPVEAAPPGRDESADGDDAIAALRDRLEQWRSRGIA